MGIYYELSAAFLANFHQRSPHCHWPISFFAATIVIILSSIIPRGLTHQMTRKGRCGRERFWNCCKSHKNSQPKPILDRMQGCCPVLQTFPRKILTFPPHADLARVLYSFYFQVNRPYDDHWQTEKKWIVLAYTLYRELQSKTNFALTIYRDVKVQWKWLEIENKVWRNVKLVFRQMHEDTVEIGWRSKLMFTLFFLEK